MARVGKLRKLKSAMKRLPSLTKMSRGGDGGGSKVATILTPVLVGKSRRRFDVGEEVVQHRLFRELVETTGSEDHNGQGVHVADCEVVMFEHLLWMIHNSLTNDDDDDPDDLVHFYTC